MSICTLHYTQPHIPNILHALCAPRSKSSKKSCTFQPCTHSHACEQEGAGASAGTVRVGRPPRTFWVVCVWVCASFCGVSRLRVSAVWWSRVRVMCAWDVGVGCAGGRWCRTRRACTSWHRVACMCACVLIHLFNPDHTLHMRERDCCRGAWQPVIHVGTIART